ncbi:MULTISPECIES: hypothetical protein [unclassified Frondihabitans]|uniref:hypothetical protein n=1 Tax=unclassified Frondihabitans TaxID=2626248 RepID=UPI0006FAD670|nr:MULTISPECIES: hypothetical protein [unclassified Frondihabitans]KQQ28676.1 hypothetical protein ASF54_08540 [Frondihabitans sp. Leaf304]MBF4575629.1 hypothetical protein [Frondihabitans sp. VKM Ac-2883]
MTDSPNSEAAGPFDIREFTRTAQGNFRADLDLTSYEAHPLDAETLELVRYLSRLEAATMEHLRNLLVTATHKDARVTAFLVTWAFEKFWMADALDAVLGAHGLDRTRNVDEGPPRTGADEAIQRSGPIRRAIAAVGLGAPIVATHMTLGLVDEWILRAAYDHLRATTDSPALRDTIGRIQIIKQRHEAFFADETEWRLSDSKRAARQTRAALATAAWPIGGVERAAADRDRFEAFVFSGSDGSARADDIGRRVASLPGMDARIGQTTAKKLTP